MISAVGVPSMAGAPQAGTSVDSGVAQAADAGGTAEALTLTQPVILQAQAGPDGKIVLVPIQQQLTPAQQALLQQHLMQQATQLQLQQVLLRQQQAAAATVQLPAGGAPVTGIRRLGKGAAVRLGWARGVRQGGDGAQVPCEAMGLLPKAWSRPRSPQRWAAPPPVAHWAGACRAGPPSA